MPTIDPAASRPWSRWVLGVPLALLVAVALLLGTAGTRRIDPAAPGAGVPGGGVAATAVAGLVAPGGSDLATAVPSGFEAVMGYAPVPERLAGGAARMVKADGACSAPGGGTRFGFDAACRAHDYGYDLLRYADATGEALSGDARKLIDGMFAGDLLARCRATRLGLSAAACKATAAVFATATGVNSWRQHYGNPGPEAPPVWLLGPALAMLAVPMAPRLRRGLRRRLDARRRGRHDGAGWGAPARLERGHAAARTHVQ